MATQAMSWRLLLLLLVVSACTCNKQRPPRDNQHLSAGQPSKTQPLPMAEGSAPCEVSALIRAVGQPQLVFAADNERSKHLYRFTLNGTRLGDGHELTLPGPRRPRDIEALTILGDELVVVGSHSRNSHCESKPKRHRIGRYRWNPRGLEHRLTLHSPELPFQNLASCQRRLFTERFTLQEPLLTRQVCETLVSAAQSATPDDCRTLNIEGAMVIGDGIIGDGGIGDGGIGNAVTKERLWLGLRAPLLSGRALLLRLAAWQTLTFDAILLLDLGGRGIRELLVHEQSVYVIAGSPGDERTQSRLMRYSISQWKQARSKASVPVKPQTLATVSGDAESLVLTDGGALIVTDGAEGGDGCKHLSTQRLVTF